MNVKTRSCKLALLIWAALAIASTASAQDQDTPGQPKPAGRGIPGLAESTTQDENNVQDSSSGWNPDTMPLTGLQTPTLGSPEFGHSYWVPGLQYGSTIFSRPSGVGSPGDWYVENYFLANLSLLQEWRRSQLVLNYSGGGYVTNEPGQSNGQYQQLAFAQNFTWRRWRMLILDQFAYLPETRFGFGQGTGLGLPGISGSLGPSVPGINGSVLPNQSIYAAVGPQYNNSFVSQLTYQTSQRGSITVGGSYGLLRFTQAGNVDSDSYTGSVGYNYMLTKEDSIGLFYRFAAYHFQVQPQALGDQIIAVGYERKVTKRLALQIFGGPEITSYRIPVENQSQTVVGSGGITLTNSFQNGAVSGSYFHTLSGGSGVLIGSNTDQLNLLATRRLTRIWSVQGNFGFAKNRPLGNQGTDFNSVYVAGGVSRPLGKNVNLSIAYGYSNYIKNTVTINFQWHTRPLVLE